MRDQVDDGTAVDDTATARDSTASSIPAEQPTDDPTVVRTTRSVPTPDATRVRAVDTVGDGAAADDTTAGTDAPTYDEPAVVRSTQAVTRERRTTLLERYGGFYWGADFIGFVVALFFTMVFLGIVGAVVGGLGYQLGQPLPKIGHSVSQTSQNLGIGALVGSLLAIFLAYFIGGYTAGRMARFDGVKNGVGVVIWTIIVAILLGIGGAILGSNFNVASQIHLRVDPATMTAAGAVSAVVTLLDMLLGGTLGGMLGERYHRTIDLETETMR